MAQQVRDHPGFEAVAQEISRRESIPIESARAIVAKRAMTASAAAKRRNPRLKRVQQAQATGGEAFK